MVVVDVDVIVRSEFKCRGHRWQSQPTSEKPSFSAKLPARTAAKPQLITSVLLEAPPFLVCSPLQPIFPYTSSPLFFHIHEKKTAPEASKDCNEDFIVNL